MSFSTSLALLAILALPSPSYAITFVRSLASQLSSNSSHPALISSAYPLNGAPGVRIPLQWSFSISFLADTCGGDEESDVNKIVYSSTGLPPWLVFDPEGLTFSGETPDSPTDADVSLTCSQGDSTASQSFAISVHGQLAVHSNLTPIETSPRNEIIYDLRNVIEDLTVDKSKLGDTQKQAVSVQVDGTIDWLDWNSTAKALMGTLPDSYIAFTTPSNISIPLMFNLPGVLSATKALEVTIQPYIFTALMYPDYHVSGSFDIPITPLLRDPTAAVQVQLQPPDAASWITFDTSKLVISGTVPDHLSYSDVLVSLQAASRSSNLTAVASFNITTGAHGAPHAFVSGLSKTMTILIVLVSIFGVLLLFGLGYFLLVGCSKLRDPSEKGDGGARSSRMYRAGTGATGETLVGSSATLDAFSAGKKWWRPWSKNERPDQEKRNMAQLSRTQSQSVTDLVRSPSVRTPVPSDVPPTVAIVEPSPRESWTGRSPRPLSNLTAEEAKLRWDGLPTATPTRVHDLFGIPQNTPRTTDTLPTPFSSTSPPPTGMQRSVSYPTTINTTTTHSSARPSDVSSVASWDSLDSWELERRQHYESPRRRGDFAPPTGKRSKRQSKDRIPAIPESVSMRREGATIEEVPSIVVTAFAEGALTGLGIKTPGAAGPSSSERNARTERSQSEGSPVMDYGEEDPVFFPRPLGAEMPGSGLARSPHLEGLSRFSGSSV